MSNNNQNKADEGKTAEATIDTATIQALIDSNKELVAQNQRLSEDMAAQQAEHKEVVAGLSKTVESLQAGVGDKSAKAEAEAKFMREQRAKRIKDSFPADAEGKKKKLAVKTAVDKHIVVTGGKVKDAK